MGAIRCLFCDLDPFAHSLTVASAWFQPAFFASGFGRPFPANVLGLRFGFIINTLPLFGNVLFARGFRQSLYDSLHEVHTISNGHA